jgi:hypothetical protein
MAALKAMNRGAKRMIMAAGIPPSFFLESVSQFLKLSQFERTTGLKTAPFFEDRFKLYEYLQTNLVGASPIDYLEFGVFKGRTIKRWSELNPNPDSRFFGFDSFEGLPEAWKFSTETVPAGLFSTNGVMPEVDDRRVQFVKGLFQDSLPGFVADFQPRNRLVIHLDADLYTSTLFVLSYLDRFLSSGSILIFDEFNNVTGEFKAFEDYAASFRRKYKVLAHAGPFYEQVAIQIQ